MSALGAALQAARRAPFQRAGGAARQQLQTRSIRKNAHVEAWDGWRADVHKRFTFDASKVLPLFSLLVVFPGLLYVLASREDEHRGGPDYVEKRFKQDMIDYRLMQGLDEDEE